MKKLTIFFAAIFLATAGLQAQTYDSADKEALRAFLRQPSAETGKLNLEQLGLSTTDTTNWQTSDENWVPFVAGLTWNSNSPKRLTGINWYSKNIAGSLNLSGCDALISLNCYSNQLSALDVSTNTALTELSCYSNQLSALELSTNTALTTLYCSSNQLKFSTLPANTIINYSYSSQAELEKGKVSCAGGVDLSSEYSIGATPDTTVFIWYNAVDNTRIDNSLITNSSGLITFDPSLSGKLLYCTMQNAAFHGLTLVCRVFVVANLSDEVFHAKDKEALRAFLRQPSSNNSWNGANLGLAATDTTYWQTSDENWVPFVAGLTWDGSTPKRLTGISWDSKKIAGILNLSACDSLTYLSCLGNRLSTLDVSGCTNLSELYCYSNQLSTLDVSTNTALTKLYCSSNQLSALDVSTNTALTKLYCYYNQLSALELSTNIALTTLSCYSNQLSALFVGTNTALTSLNCSSNQLSALVLSTNTALTTLSCYSNQLSTLDVSKNIALTSLSCYSNQLSTLDVSKNIALTSLSCYSNQLSILDVSKNTKLTSLSCYSNQLSALNVSTNTALTSLYCDNNQLSILDVSKNIALKTLYCYSNQLKFSTLPANTISYYSYSPQAELEKGKVSCAGGVDLSSEYSIGATPDTTVFTWYDAMDNTPINNLLITNNSGLITFAPSLSGKFLYCTMQNAAFHGLTLVCRVFVVANLSDEVFHAKDKEALRAFLRQPSSNNSWNGANLGLAATDTTYWQTSDENWVTSVAGLAWDGSTPKRLTGISWDSKNIAGSLNLSACDSLTYLSCYSNQLSALDVSGCTNLSELYCYSNQLSALELSTNTALTELYCYSNQLSTLDVSKNTALTELYCSFNQLNALNVSTNTALTSLNCSDNQLSTLDVSGCTNLSYLDCYSNELNALNVSTNTALTSLDCYSNELNALNVSTNTALTTLDCYSNQLTTLNVSGCTNLSYLNCYSNQLSTLDVSTNTALTELYCYSNQLSALVVNGCTNLSRLYCSDNHLSLAILDTLSKRTDITNKYLGTQSLPMARVPLNTAVAVDTVFRGNNTTFVVLKYNGTLAVENTDYSVSGGEITFLTAGIYNVETTNSDLTSKNIAKVVNFYLVDTDLPVAKKTVPFTEDFESGATGWTFSNGAQPNQWMIGNATAKSGSQAIYISDNGTDNQYNIGSKSVVHFFCDVAFTPSTTDYRLSFDWKGVGEKNYDDLKIFLTDTTELPFAGYTVNGNLLGTYVNDTLWQQAAVHIPASYAGTVKRLVFSWRNDGSVGENPPAAIDNIAVKNLEVSASGISLNKHELSLAVDATETLIATVSPANATNKNVSWASRNEGIATVNASGLVTGKTAGTTYIVATTQEGGFKDSCLATVSANAVVVTGISLNTHELSLKVDATETLIATVSPANATNKNVSWASRNEGIATVNASGLVTGKTAGTTYIVATTQEGGFKDSCLVTVTPETDIETPSSKENALVVYPNPIYSGKLTIESGKWNSQTATSLRGTKQSIEIFDLNGKLVGTFAITDEKTEINISYLPSGTYLVKVGDAVRKITKR